MNRLTKSETDKALFGVCAGIAEFFNISPLIVRVLFLLTPAVFTIYLLLAAFLPKKSLY
ncbi:PspC domain-containing protein [Sporosarcina soli]|uniref:PspC domain-containing protein n=1 Tax=Sporosarcina soli TaxID=334736 RepID=A0ABW0TG76_9BACL